MERKEKKSRTARGAGQASTDDSVQRGLRWPKSLDARVEQTATRKGYRSPQEFIISAVIEKLDAEAQAA